MVAAGGPPPDGFLPVSEAGGNGLAVTSACRTYEDYPIEFDVFEASSLSESALELEYAYSPPKAGSLHVGLYVGACVDEADPLQVNFVGWVKESGPYGALDSLRSGTMKLDVSSMGLESGDVVTLWNAYSGTTLSVEIP